MVESIGATFTVCRNLKGPPVEVVTFSLLLAKSAVGTIGILTRRFTNQFKTWLRGVVIMTKDVRVRIDVDRDDCVEAFRRDELEC